MFFGRKKKKIKFDDLPKAVQEELEMIEIEMMEGFDPTETFRRLAKKYPGYFPVRLNLASTLLNAGNLAEAKSIYKNVAKDFPDELGAVAGLATIHESEGDYEQAEQLAQKAIDGGYNWPPSYGVIANAKEKRGDSSGAAEVYLQGYRKSPHSWDYLQQYCKLNNRQFTPPTDEEIEPCITLKQLDVLASFVDEKMGTPDADDNAIGCDHTFKFAEEWATQNNVDIIELYQFLNRHGGFCDCEICFNVTQLLIEEEE